MGVCACLALVHVSRAAGTPAHLTQAWPLVLLAPEAQASPRWPSTATCSRLLPPRHARLLRQGISEADAEGAVRPAVNSLMRSEGPLLAKAAANGGLEPSALLELQ